MRPFKRFISGLVALLTIVSLVGPVVQPTRAAELDYAIANGRFFSQANGRGGEGGTGFSVVDGGNIPFWTEYQQGGGPSVLGYPITRRFLWDGFVVQAMQKVVLQWRPDASQVSFLNVFDVMGERGLNNWLETVKSIPAPFDTAPDAGLSWDQIVRRHQGMLDSSPQIKARYFADSDPILHFGLPMSYRDYGNVFVVRAQRAVFQLWKQDVPWAKAGEVTIANGGDLAKEAGLWGQAAGEPEPAGGIGSIEPIAVAAPPQAPAQPAAPPAVAPSGFPYRAESVTWEPNCGMVAAKFFVKDPSGTPINDIRVHLETGGGSFAVDSRPTGSSGYATGWADIFLRGEPIANGWTVWAIGGDGSRQSDSYTFNTDTADCKPGGPGKQVATVTFIKGAAGPAPAPAPAQPAPAPAPAPVASGFPFRAESTVWEPNCGMVATKIFVKEANGTPINNVRIHMDTGGGSYAADAKPTGTQGAAPGWTDLFLRGEPIDNAWAFWVIGDDGSRLSENHTIWTDTVDCKPGGPGKQVATITFVRGAAAPVAAPAAPAPAPAAPAPAPAPAPAQPSGMPYRFTGVSYLPNCGLQQAKITVRDNYGNMMNGVKLKIESNGWSAASNPTGSMGYGAGETDFTLRMGADLIDNTWKIFVVDDSGNNRLSDVFQFATTKANCEPSGSGQQIVMLSVAKQ